MVEIKKNMYVRTKKRIGKITKLDKYPNEFIIETDFAI